MKMNQPSTRREQEKQLRKEAIIDAAEVLFREKGFQRFTMDDVAARAEFTKRTLYAYFKSKEHLFLAIVLRAFRISNTMMDNALRKNDNCSGLERLGILSAAYIEFSRKYRWYFRAIIEYENREDDFLADDELTVLSYKEGEHGLDLINEALIKGASDGSIKNIIPEIEKAIILWLMLTGVISMINRKALYLKKKHKIDTGKLITDTVEMFFKLMSK